MSPGMWSPIRAEKEPQQQPASKVDLLSTAPGTELPTDGC